MSCRKTTVHENQIKFIHRNNRLIIETGTLLKFEQIVLNKIPLMKLISLLKEKVGLLDIVIN